MKNHQYLNQLIYCYYLKVLNLNNYFDLLLQVGNRLTL